MYQFDCALIPPAVLQISDVLKPSKTYLVGGIIRDTLLAAINKNENQIKKVVEGDWDLATPHPPNEVLKRLRRAGITSVPIGFEHGTVAAVIDGQQYEITTFRYDLKYEDGRHPIVQFTDSIEEDLKRRDFTINAFAVDVENGKILDYFDGIKDLQAKCIRTVGNPFTRFREDYLRMLRACRFAAKLEGEIESRTCEAIKERAIDISHISAERIRDELMKMLSYPRPSLGFQLMYGTGLLLYILPELEAGFDVYQNRFHSHDVANHTLLAVDALSPDYPLIRFATLMHDLGKVPAKAYLPYKDDYVFYSHQYISKRMAMAIMRRLRFSNKEIEVVKRIVENHMYNLKPDLSKAATRRFVQKLGRENVEPFLRMRMADRKGNLYNNDGYEKGIFHFARNVRSIDQDEDALKLTDLKLSGHDLIDMGLKPGPVFSTILNQLLDEVIEEPERNTREYLMERAESMAEQYRQTGQISIPDREMTQDE